MPLFLLHHEKFKKSVDNTFGMIETHHGPVVSFATPRGRQSLLVQLPTSEGFCAMNSFFFTHGRRLLFVQRIQSLCCQKGL